jgi:hypothetical protein
VFLVLEEPDIGPVSAAVLDYFLPAPAGAFYRYFAIIRAPDTPFRQDFPHGHPGNTIALRYRYHRRMVFAVGVYDIWYELAVDFHSSLPPNPI